MAIIKSLSASLSVPYSSDTWVNAFNITGKGYIKSSLGLNISYPNTGGIYFQRVRVTIDGVASILSTSERLLIQGQGRNFTMFMDVEFKESIKIDVINDFYSYGNAYINVSVPVVLE